MADRLQCGPRAFARAHDVPAPRLREMVRTGEITRILGGGNDLVNWAVHRDDPERLEILLEHSGWGIFAGWGAFPNLLIDCGPRTARVFADWVPLQPDPTGVLVQRILGTVSTRMGHRPGGQRLILAADALCGDRLREISAPDWSPEHRLLIRLRSNHGRLPLKARFPDFLSVLLANPEEIEAATGCSDS